MEDFTDLGYLTIDWIDRLPPVRPLKRFLADGGIPGDGGSLRASVPSLIGGARLSVAKVVDWPLHSVLRAVKAPGQMLYCLARRKESNG